MQYIYTISITDNKPSFYLWQKKKLVKYKKVSKYNDRDCL